MTIHKVFYSWQSDSPTQWNREFIEMALEEAAKSIRNDASVEIEPVIDRDTKEVPGAPDIASTVLEKINNDQIFVGDVSIINPGSRYRETPNPNVLIELGYAMKAMGPGRLILVMNTAFAGPNRLPFDLRSRRVIPYCVSDGMGDSAAEQSKLVLELDHALRDILKGIAAEESTKSGPSLFAGDQARLAIEQSRPDQASRVREFMEGLVTELESLAPKLSGVERPNELLVPSLDRAKGVVIEFGRVGEAIATYNAAEAALTAYKSFGPILEHYRPPLGFGGDWFSQDFDFYVFLGHELLVTLFSFLVREARWDLVADLLEEGILINNSPRGLPGLVSFDYACGEVVSLMVNSRSLHPSVLRDRHLNGDLGKLVPLQEFQEADYLLYLRAELEAAEPGRGFRWLPWSVPDVGYYPKFLIESTHVKYAQRLLRPLGVPDLKTLRARWAQRLGRTRFDPETIGSQ